MKKHDEEQAQLQSPHDRCKQVLNFMSSRIDLNQLVLALDTPVRQNPLVVLANI